MASLQSDGVDDVLFDLYKKQVLKHLKSKMSPDMLRTLALFKVDAVGTSDIASRKSRLDSFLSSMVAGEDAHTFDISELFLSGLNSRLESTFGSVLSKEAISGIVGLFALRGSSTLSMLEENEKLVVDVLKFLVDSSCIQMNGSMLIMLPLKRKGVCKSPTAPAKRITKNAIPVEGALNIDAKVLFPEVQINQVIDEPTDDDCDVVFVKEVRLNDKLNMMSNNSDALYNKHIDVGSIVHNGAATLKNKQPTVALVNEEMVSDKSDYVSIRESARFPLSPESKMVYNALFSLARSKLSRSIVVEIGKCNLTYQSLGESMITGTGVSSYVINILCRKFFLDKHPTISRKHFFFSQISDVFLSDSPDYSQVEKSFTGAGKVLKLHECDQIFFPARHRKHWFLFIVDMQLKFFLFLDSLEFSSDARKKMINGFLNAWALFANSNTRFDDFKAAYPKVPKQENDADCGIFVIKFMELYGNGSRMIDLFGPEDIPSLRVQIVNKLVFSEHNNADKQPFRDRIAAGGTRR